MTIHSEVHPMAGKTVTIKGGFFDGMEYKIEDWWDRVAGRSWKNCDGNPACLDYAIRSVTDSVPLDDNVVYGKVSHLGKLIHASHIANAL